jgi:hypothetical protein
MLKLNFLLGIFLIATFLGCCQFSKRIIDPKSIDSIVLVQVRDPYLGHRIRSIKLPDTLYKSFVLDFANKHEEPCIFYSCYVIKIFFRNGNLISYRTDGNTFEKFKDEDETGIYFTLNDSINLITKYWGIPKKEFCDSAK